VTSARSSAQVAALVLAALALLSCGPPGVVIEIYNATNRNVVVREAYNDASTTTHHLAPGAGAEFGPALAWHVAILGHVFEVQHPGDRFGRSRAFGQQLFRFQAVPPGCLFAPLPEQQGPVAEPPEQPRGFPLGPSALCAPAAAAR